MLLALLLLQAAPPAPAAQLPDIELDIRAHAREVRIVREGAASLEVRAGPDGGNIVHVDAPVAAGRTRMRNVGVEIRAEARIADPFEDRARQGPTDQNPPPPETPEPQ
jgi:hypothetical protein